jgi:hypothetical protein
MAGALLAGPNVQTILALRRADDVGFASGDAVIMSAYSYAKSFCRVSARSESLGKTFD